jgi:hypothetical protein
MIKFAVFYLFPEKNKKKDDQCKKTCNSEKEKGIRKRIDKFSLQSRVNMVIEVLAQRADLGKNGQKEQQEENDQVQCPFGDDCSEGFVEWDLLVFCEDPATGHLAEPWKGHVGKITDHDGIKSIFKGRMISHGLQKDHPP